jgi:hypothetical protein
MQAFNDSRNEPRGRWFYILCLGSFLLVGTARAETANPPSVDRPAASKLALQRLLLPVVL